MNRYTKQGMISDAADGKSVIYVDCRADWDIDGCVALAETLGLNRVIRSNGREEIRFNGGGRLSFVSSTESSLRGHTADLVVLGPAVSKSAAHVESARAVVATRPQGEVIRA